MAKAMKAEAETDPQRALAQAELDLAAAQAAYAALVERAGGVVERHSVHREQRTVVRQTGVVEVIDVDAPHVETESLGLVERLRARRGVAGAEERVRLAEEHLAEARQQAAVAERTARDALVREGEALLRAELPTLLREQRRLQTQWRQLETRCRALDQQLGRDVFGEWAWSFVMAAGGLLDEFVTRCRERFGLDA